MSFIKNNTVLEFNNSFSSRQSKGNPVFEGGYLISDTGSFYREKEKKEAGSDYYLQIKCGADFSATGISLIKSNRVSQEIQNDNSFSFFIKNYSNQEKSTLFRGDVLLTKIDGEGASFDCLLERDLSETYYLKVSNGEMGGEKYIANDTFGQKTFLVNLGASNGQKIFGLDIQYSDGELSSMTPNLVDTFSTDYLNLSRNEEGVWNESDSFSMFVPISIVDLDSKSTTNVNNGDINISNGSSSSLGINGKSGPTF